MLFRSEEFRILLYTQPNNVISGVPSIVTCNTARATCLEEPATYLRPGDIIKQRQEEVCVTQRHGDEVNGEMGLAGVGRSLTFKPRFRTSLSTCSRFQILRLATLQTFPLGRRSEEMWGCVRTTLVFPESLSSGKPAKETRQ